MISMKKSINSLIMSRRSRMRLSRRRSLLELIEL